MHICECVCIRWEEEEGEKGKAEDGGSKRDKVYSKHSGKPREDFKQVSDMILIV